MPPFGTCSLQRVVSRPTRGWPSIGFMENRQPVVCVIRVRCAWTFSHISNFYETAYRALKLLVASLSPSSPHEESSMALASLRYCLRQGLTTAGSQTFFCHCLDDFGAPADYSIPVLVSAPWTKL